MGELLAGNLGLAGLAVPDDFDDDPPAALLAALADRTGVDLARIQGMTLAGWRPWLLDTVEAPDTQAAFDAYVRAYSVLLAPRTGGAGQVARYQTWRGPWRPRHRHDRTCPVCAALPDRGRTLLGRLPLMVGCGEHGCRLQDTVTVQLEMAVHGRPPAPVAVPEPLATLDRYTHQALLSGRVNLPGRDVHAGVWFRLLRTLVHELSLAPGTMGRREGRTLELVWQSSGHPVRAGLRLWQPYEHLPWGTQETMLHAAAVPLQLATDGRIAARGVLGAAIQPAPWRQVYAGDPPSRYRAVWLDAAAAAQTMLDHARTDRASARQVLAVLTKGRPHRAVHEREIAFLQRNSVPAGFLPDADELDLSFPVDLREGTGQPGAEAARR
ncbi:TniQ family protein [Cellulomonas sp. NS3]|uniref:TniQ family protein n=1 Tax=Cellulomonas sp. NS3 TaxID=2973977 RepID=UPI002161295F|nr:TniQ family protein [Cellulomonas sp. NS3]